MVIKQIKKILFATLTFLVFAGLTFLVKNNNQFIETLSISKDANLSKEFTAESKPENSFLTSYKISAELNQTGKTLTVSQKISWVNNSEFSTGEIYFNLFPNAFRNSKTMYMNGRVLPDESITRISIKKLSVNNIDTEFFFVIAPGNNPYDSTVAKILLDDKILPFQNVIIQIEYELNIPKSIGRFGYEKDGEFLFLAQWYPKICVFEKGKWEYRHYYPLTEFNNEFADYDITLRIPKTHSVAAGGTLASKADIQDYVHYKYISKNVIDFAWAAGINYFNTTYSASSGNEIVKVNLFQSKVDEELFQRVKESSIKAIEFLQKNIGTFPYEQITLVEVPNKKSRIANMEYPSLITFSANYFSPDFTLNPEETIIHEIVHQYFYASLANDETNEAWLDEGFASYLTSKILDYFYPPKFNYFKLFGELPVRGLLLLDLEQLPLIYSLSNIQTPSYINSLTAYYRWGNRVSLSDSSKSYRDQEYYYSHAYARGELFLRSLDNIIGEEKIYKILSEYYFKNKNRRVTALEFFNSLSVNIDAELYGTVLTWYNSKESCDYKIVSINKDFVGNSYNVYIEKEGDINFPLNIFVYTTEDTIRIKWNGVEKYKTINISSTQPVISAEIDPERKNLFDKDFANNSYTISKQYGGSLSILFRWMFWVQNFLLIFGGIA